jgi:uncharacterized protein (AIM24 family)/DNA-directed RNA polymerase subunit RPC12/RpoP
LPQDAHFCVTCGSKVVIQEAAAPVVPDPVAPAAPVGLVTHMLAAPAPLAPEPATLRAVRAVRCSWCGTPLDSTTLSCSGCGGKVTEMGETTRSGWQQVPGRKDMAKLQFGQSVCQIEGTYVPVADFKLAGSDSVYFAHHVLLWKDPETVVSTMSLKGAWKRMFAGMPLIMTQAVGPGHIAFSRDAPGELIAVPIHPGQSVDVREHLFLCATGNVVYDWFSTNVWFRTRTGDDTETHYPVGAFMDRFSGTQQPGLLLLHAAGNVFVRNLGPGETMLVKPTALIFKDPAVEMHLHFEHPSAGFFGWGSWSNRYVWLRVIGPGRIAVQSVFEHLEGETQAIQGTSYATEMRW